MPAGYLSGSILAVAGASLAGRPMLIPVAMMRHSAGATRHLARRRVTPETLHAWRLSAQHRGFDRGDGLPSVSAALSICAWCTAGTRLPHNLAAAPAGCRR